MGSHIPIGVERKKKLLMHYDCSVQEIFPHYEYKWKIDKSNNKENYQLVSSMIRLRRLLVKKLPKISKSMLNTSMVSLAPGLL